MNNVNGLFQPVRVIHPMNILARGAIR